MLYEVITLKRVGERGQGRFEPVSWEEALSTMASTFDRVRRESGPEYLALCQGTGRPYTEFTGRFIHSLGSPNFVSPGHNCFLVITSYSIHYTKLYEGSQPTVMAEAMLRGRKQLWPGETKLGEPRAWMKRPVNSYNFV